ncbi:MAG: exonuclease domain-containing protein [Lachnospiraceae bacterium]|nr:exonuclease domain-containing protein [Lachnospiraceae bacterium]
MNYIVFDLEWNQCPYGKNREVKTLPFEIIEIGAIKLNKDRKYVDRFHKIIKPIVYPKLHFRTKEIVHLDQDTLKKGTLFPDALREFLSWAGTESQFCTWGTVDLVELQRNMKYYGLLSLLKGPLHYYDLQKLFAVSYEDMKKRRSLEYGIDFLKLEKVLDFHRALSDAWYTAEIFRKIDMNVVLSYDSIDVYQNPKTKKEEIYAVYNGYSKFISREFNTKEEAMEDNEVLKIHCCFCDRSAKKKLRWFSVNSKNYYCIAICPVHGYIKGKARMKRTEEGRVYVVKTIKMSSEMEAKEIREKKMNCGKILKKRHTIP